jgi:hypothetical protein
MTPLIALFRFVTLVYGLWPVVGEVRRRWRLRKARATVGDGLLAMDEVSADDREAARPRVNWGSSAASEPFL